MKISEAGQYSSSSSGSSIYSSLFSFLSLSILSTISSLSGTPNVSGRQKMKHHAIPPKKAVGNQLLTPIEEEMTLMNGDMVLPICPTTLVQPKPKLRISVGQSSAMYTQKIDQKLHSIKRSIINTTVSIHLNAVQFQGVQIITKKPKSRHMPADIPIPIKVDCFLLHLWMRSSAEKYPIISLIPKITWLMVLLNPTVPWFSCEEQYIIWIPKRMMEAEMEVHRILRYRNKSKNPSDLCSQKNYYSSPLSTLSTASRVSGYLLFVYAILLRTSRAPSELFLSMNIGVSSIKRQMSTNQMMKVTSIIQAISSHVIFVAKIKAIVVYPNAQVICTPTPYLALDLPRQISFMNEKQSVTAGFVPNPMRNSPNPIILGESAMQMIMTATVPIPQAILKANFLPQLSAMQGMTKKPKMAPTKSMDWRRETTVSWSSQMRQVSKWKTMEGECHNIYSFLNSGDSPQIQFWQADSSLYFWSLQVKLLSKKNPIPSSSHEVRNHMNEKIKKDCI